MEPRRSGNYQASMWNDAYVQSLATPYADKEHVNRLEGLITQAKEIIDETMDHCGQLELIDILQRLGISYHFKYEIKNMLKNMYAAAAETCNGDNAPIDSKEDLYHTALRFRLLRLHAYHVPREVFLPFVDEDGNFRESLLTDDVKGVLALYEASFLSVEGETMLDSAKEFSIRCLKGAVDRIKDHNLERRIRHAMVLPLHWRVQKLEAKWFIDVYEKSDHQDTIINLVFLELAKLDFNVVQSRYQREVKHMSSWYKQTGLEEKLSFARHRLVEGLLWTVGTTPEPHHSRITLTKIGTLITVIDDIYDVYGTLEELKAFTDAFERFRFYNYRTVFNMFFVRRSR